MPIADDYQAFVQSVGMPPPSSHFPAVITGVAWPQHQKRLGGANVSLADPYPSCDEPDGLDDCGTSALPLPDADGLLPDEMLPCGVYPIRYMWKALDRNLNSRMCGIRPIDGGQWIVWRQAFYAVNTAHFVQDQNLNYPPVTKGTNVIMSWNRVGVITGDNPQWGFCFNHHSDPYGTKRCPPEGGTFNPNAQGCCSLRDRFSGQIVLQYCDTAMNCIAQDDGIQIEATWLGDGVDCQPPFTSSCAGAFDNQQVCCSGGLLTGGICLTRDECNDLIQQGQATTLDDTGEVPCPVLVCDTGGDGGAGAEPGGRPGRRGSFRLVTKDHKLGACPQIG